MEKKALNEKAIAGNLDDLHFCLDEGTAVENAYGRWYGRYATQETDEKKCKEDCGKCTITRIKDVSLGFDGGCAAAAAASGFEQYSNSALTQRGRVPYEVLLR